MTHFIGFVLMILCFDADHPVLGALLAGRMVWDATLFLGKFLEQEELF